MSHFNNNYTDNLKQPSGNGKTGEVNYQKTIFWKKKKNIN